MEFVGYDKLPAGQNATATTMSYSGYDIEVAILGRVRFSPRLYQDVSRLSVQQRSPDRGCSQKEDGAHPPISQWNVRTTLSRGK